ncbi:MAG: DUF1559 domain-containing protein [Planctomycetia bacterium]|nr:DUF1559 domain-containing protein [Planctomycetia bacterium]
MLRAMKSSRATPLIVASHQRLLAMLIAIGLPLAGLRGPTSNIPARAAAPDAGQAEDANQQAFNRSKSFNNLKQIMLAMHNYHDAEKSFPPAVGSQDGKPLLSWRVAILPYLEGEEAKAVWAEFHLDEPWDSDHNKELAAKMPPIYRSPTSKLNDGRTVYLTARGSSTAFPGQQAIGIRKITDGTSNTIAVVEVDDKYAVPWTKPDDWKFDPDHPKVGLGGQFNGGFNAAFCDGSVHFIGNDVDEKILKALFTMAGGEIVVLPN